MSDTLKPFLFAVRCGLMCMLIFASMSGVRLYPNYIIKSVSAASSGEFNYKTTHGKEITMKTNCWNIGDTVWIKK